jgi:hypothetical protein
MSKRKSPGAVAARGALEIDELGGRVVSEARRGLRRAQVPIYATLTGNDRCGVEGIMARGAAPVLDLCRKLIKAGCDPRIPLEAWRGATLCLRVRSIGEGAKLTVRSAGNGCPIFAPVGGSDGAGSSPARQITPAVVDLRPDANRFRGPGGARRRVG